MKRRMGQDGEGFRGILFNLFAVKGEAAKGRGGMFFKPRITAPPARYASIKPSLAPTIARHRARAFTLAEVLIGVMLFSIGMAALCMTISFNLATTRSAQENLRASQIMVEKMEYLRLCTWGQITNDTSIQKTFAAPLNLGSTNSDALVYGRISIDPVSFNNNFATNMRLVTVSVNWKSKRPQSRQMQTFVSRDGLERYVY